MEHEEAAARAGVVIRELREIGEFEQVYRLFDEIWHPEPANVPVTVELMAGFAHTGNYVAGAFAGDALVGASVGFLASGEALHSHVTGAVVGKGVGYALKLHQRDWCRERGLARITWTFDPLVRRNAHFNLVKLGARPEAYLTEFYGAMADAINEGDASDRLLAVWRVTGQQDEEEKKKKADLGEAYPLVREADDGGPITAEAGDRGPVTAEAHEREPLSEEAGDRRPLSGDAGERGPLSGDAGRRRVLLVGTPRDVERLRREDAGKAMAWRMAVREALGGAMAAGARVAGFTERGEYVVVIN